VYTLRAGGTQIHDLNPSLSPPLGLFWTIAIADDSVQVQLGKGSAQMDVTDVPIFDYESIPNSLFGGQPGVPGTVSFKIVWSVEGSPVKTRNTDPVFGGFRGEFIRSTAPNAARMEWSATVGELQLVSDPLTTSFSVFAEIGHEQNGSFFPPGS
jgi:hypothetical protein